MLFERVFRDDPEKQRRLTAVGQGSLMLGLGCTSAAIFVNRHVNGGGTIEWLGVSWGDPLVIGLSVVGSALIGVSIVFNVKAAVEYRRQRERRER